ncbi:MAG: type 4a pilus biogenesis protein PilO [Nevskia sp.]
MTVQEVFAELQALDIQNPGAWPRWAHIGAVALTSVLIIGFGIYFLVVPQYDNLGVEQQKEVTLRQDFERKQKKVAALDAYRAQLDTMERDFGAMLRQLPSKTEVENLLNDISQTRVASSLEEELFQPQPETPKDFYAEVPHKIIVTGNYHQMGAFVGGVAALPRIVTIDEVEIKPLGSAPGQASIAKGALRMSALAKTYRYLDSSEITAAKPAAPGGPKQ